MVCAEYNLKHRNLHSLRVVSDPLIFAVPMYYLRQKGYVSYRVVLCFVMGVDACLYQMPKPIYCGSNKKLHYHCDSKPACYTDYHPHYSSNMSLSELLVGSTQWEYSSAQYRNWTFPDTQHLELRPGYSATHGVHSGEIHFRLDLERAGRVVVVGYHYGNFLLASDFLVELDVSAERLSSGYEPNEDKRHLWDKYNAEEHMKAGVAVLAGVPGGRHVLSVRSKVNEKKAVAGVSHIIIHYDD